MTAISEVSICNMALADLGAMRIASLGENSENAELCNLKYDRTREDVLTDHIWNFAQKRAVLATLSADPVWTDDDMTIVYQKPTDCLKINYVNIRSAIFKIEEDKILSNTTGLKIKYTQNITDPNKFFSKFISALVTRLAAELAYPITTKRTLAESLFRLYYDTQLPLAKSMDSQQGTPQGAIQDEWLLSRIHGSTSLSGRTGDETWYPCCW
jgi:hypothetical protein